MHAKRIYYKPTHSDFFIPYQQVINSTSVNTW